MISSCAIALVSIKGLTPGKLSNKLRKEHKIHTTSVVWENISGVRVTPHVYTRTKDLERFINALITIADET